MVLDKEQTAVIAKMDEAADKATEAFKQVIAEHPDGVEAVAKWWQEYYKDAGHKRLGRILLTVGG